ncbi:MAG: hypothetical protein AAGF94_01765 [Pseudomonadota bacterium]
MGWVRAETEMGSVAINAEIGNLRELCFVSGERRIEPLHTAHWVGGGEIPDDIASVEQDLAGDFFCAPFGQSDLVDAPPHGWSANSHWTITRLEPDEVALSLDTSVMGASIHKALRLSRNAPLLYQTHTIDGGQGSLTVAHHPMVHVTGRGRLFASPKRAALSPDTPLEPGRNALACPARTTDMRTFPASDGRSIDLSHLPIARSCEDFVTLVEDKASLLGWTAVLREEEDDIVFFLKDPRVLPVTMLWHSNGGRDYAPWNGRHIGVLGIEDGCTAGAAGHKAALTSNAISREGVATALPLGAPIYIRHVIGAVPRPEGWTDVADIRLSDAALILIASDGAELQLPFDPGFFAEAS